MKEEKKPFFARFLEGLDEKEQEKLKAGATCKYPSDTDDDPIG